MKVSFVLITLNEEKNLARCLRSCAPLADELVIVDSGSSDGTERIAREFGARWHRQDWLGFVGQKNRALSLCEHEWVFSVDADEELSPRLAEEVARLKKSSPADEISGWSMPRMVFYEGRWIRHGDWYPDRLTRLVRKSRARFVGGKVHERLEVEGKIEPLSGDLFHHSFRDAADHWDRCQKYARLWAENELEKGRRAGLWAAPAHATFRWVRGYLLRRGFLDGRQGWQIARLTAKEVFLKYRLLAEMSQKAK